MDTYHVVLYLHLLSLFVLVCRITLVGVCYGRLRAAASLMEATPWATLGRPGRVDISAGDPGAPRNRRVLDE